MLPGFCCLLRFRASWCGNGSRARPFIAGALGGLVRLGGWQFAAQGGGLIAGQADRYLLGAFLAPQFVGYYTIAQRLEEAMYIGILKIGEILFPFFSSLQKESTDRMADLLFRSSWVLNLLAATLLGALIPVAGPLLYAWTGKDVAVETQGLLVVLAVAGMLGCASNVFGYYLLASGRSRSNALIALVTAVVTITTSAVALPAFGWQAAGLSACLGMIAQIVITMVLLRQIVSLVGMWPRMFHFVLLPLATGIITAIALRQVAPARLFDQASHWWFVGVCYGAAAGIIFVVVVAVSRIGPYGETCWRDIRAIAGRFLPAGSRVAMCGIAGIINIDGQAVEPAEISRLTRLLAHRGPDGEGYWFSAARDVALGHRRLAIIDPGPGRIPADAVGRWQSRNRLQR